MKTNLIRLLTAMVACSAGTPAFCATFSYSYQSVFDGNAGTYIVGQQNVRRYSEWQAQPVTYWGPAANDLPALLTMRFDFAAPTAQVYLSAGVTAANWQNAGRLDYGSASLWASTDGASWQLLLNNEIPTGSTTVGATLVYNQDVPASLVGSSHFWLQVRMQEHAALTDADPLAVTWADAQFSRFDPANPGAGNTFELQVTTVPEPGLVSFSTLGLLVLCRCCRNRFRS